MRAKFDIGMEVDLVTPAEMNEALHRQSHADREWHERARGMKRLTFKLFPAAALTGTTAWVLPSTPAQGYTWNIRTMGALFSASTAVNWLLGSDQVTPATNQNLPPLGHTSGAAASIVNCGSGQEWLDPGDYIVISPSGTFTLLAVYVVVVETPAELAWKLM